MVRQPGQSFNVVVHNATPATFVEILSNSSESDRLRLQRNVIAPAQGSLRPWRHQGLDRGRRSWRYLRRQSGRRKDLTQWIVPESISSVENTLGTVVGTAPGDLGLVLDDPDRLVYGWILKQTKELLVRVFVWAGDLPSSREMFSGHIDRQTLRWPDRNRLEFTVLGPLSYADRLSARLAASQFTGRADVLARSVFTALGLNAGNVGIADYQTKNGHLDWNHARRGWCSKTHKEQAFRVSDIWQPPSGFAVRRSGTGWTGNLVGFVAMDGILNEIIVCDDADHKGAIITQQPVSNFWPEWASTNGNIHQLYTAGNSVIVTTAD